MRNTSLALLILVSVAGPLSAGDPETDAILGRWEAATRAVETATITCTRTHLDKTFGSTRVFGGTIQYIRPALFEVEMRDRAKPGEFEKRILTRDTMYEFVADREAMTVFAGWNRDPATAGWWWGLVIASIKLSPPRLVLTPEELRSQYRVRLSKQDQWYVYLDLTPATPAAKSVTTRGRLVLTKDRLLPRQIWMKEMNGNEVTWEFTTFETGVELTRTDFTEPSLPDGWQRVQVSADPPALER